MIDFVRCQVGVKLWRCLFHWVPQRNQRRLQMFRVLLDGSITR